MWSLNREMKKERQIKTEKSSEDREKLQSSSSKISTLNDEKCLLTVTEWIKGLTALKCFHNMDGGRVLQFLCSCIKSLHSEMPIQPLSRLDVNLLR